MKIVHPPISFSERKKNRESVNKEAGSASTRSTYSPARFDLALLQAIQAIPIYYTWKVLRGRLEGRVVFGRGTPEGTAKNRHSESPPFYSRGFNLAGVGAKKSRDEGNGQWTRCSVHTHAWIERLEVVRVNERGLVSCAKNLPPWLPPRVM